MEPEKLELEQIIKEAIPFLEHEEETETIVNLAGYQVTKGELFSHIREPAVTIWENRVKFNMACLRRFPGVTHIQILICPEKKRIIIRPCDPDTPDSLRWSCGGGNKEIKNRDMLCKIFAAKVFDLMNWDNRYRYKIMGRPATYKDEMLFLFKLTDFELFVNSGKKKGSYLPGEWRDYFGVPVEEHEDSYKIDLAEGYITTDKM